MADSLKIIEVPLTGWVQFAVSNNGTDWKRKTRLVAPWLQPSYPNSFNPLPNRTQEIAKIGSAPVTNTQKGCLAELAHATKVLRDFVDSSTTFISWERQFNAKGHPWYAIIDAAEEVLGQQWFTYPIEGIIEAFFDHRDAWNNVMVDLTDMQLFLFSVDTSQKLALKLAANLAPPQVISPLPTRPARRRLTSKTARTPAYFTSGTAESTAALPNSDRQLDKSWHKGTCRGEKALLSVLFLVVGDVLVTKQACLDTSKFRTERDLTEIEHGTALIALARLNWRRV